MLIEVVRYCHLKLALGGTHALHVNDIRNRGTQGSNHRFGYYSHHCLEPRHLAKDPGGWSQPQHKHEEIVSKVWSLQQAVAFTKREFGNYINGDGAQGVVQIHRLALGDCVFNSVTKLLRFVLDNVLELDDILAREEGVEAGATNTV